MQIELSNNNNFANLFFIPLKIINVILEIKIISSMALLSECQTTINSNKKEICYVLLHFAIFTNMNSNYTILEVFEYSSEAQVMKSKLEDEGYRVMLADEKTIDTDPLLSQAIGGVKLLVHNEDFAAAVEIFNQIRRYETDVDGATMQCPDCDSTQILVAPLQRKNIFYMLFPFFEAKRHVCNSCNSIF